MFRLFDSIGINQLESTPRLLKWVNLFSRCTRDWESHGNLKLIRNLRKHWDWSECLQNNLCGDFIGRKRRDERRITRHTSDKNLKRLLMTFSCYATFHFTDVRQHWVFGDTLKCEIWNLILEYSTSVSSRCNEWKRPNLIKTYSTSLKSFLSLEIWRIFAAFILCCFKF